VRISIENQSSYSDLAYKVAKLLRAKGYPVNVKPSETRSTPAKRTRIVAQRANPEDAELVQGDLGNRGEIVNASIGDIQSTVTIMAGDDLESLVTESK
jgi:hypothetical protein